MAVILFELLTGRPPFVAQDDFDLIDYHVNVEAPFLRDLDPGLPQALDDLVARALAKQAGDRFADAATMAAELELAAREL